MTSSPPDNAHFRTLDDGTVLYRRNRSTRTYIITSEQRGHISNLQGKEIAAAFLLAPPIPVFVVTTAIGNFGLLWQITGVCTLFYCALNFFLSQKISKEIDAICQTATPAAPGQDIEFANFRDGLKKAIATLSVPVRMAFFVYFLLTTGISLLLFLSAFFEIGFMNFSKAPWPSKLFFGASGTLVCGMLAFGALQIILEKRASKRNV